LDGKLPLFPSNMANSPVYAINTDNDPLYPATRMRTVILFYWLEARAQEFSVILR